MPSTVNKTAGIVYDVQNITSWKEVDIKALLEIQYGIETIMYAHDPKLIVLDGSVCKAFRFYQPAFLKVIAHNKSIEQPQVKVSDLQNEEVPVAAALHFTSDDSGHSI